MKAKPWEGDPDGFADSFRLEVQRDAAALGASRYLRGITACAVCGESTGTFRNARCPRCHAYWRRHGRERPLTDGALKKGRTPARVLA